MTTRKLALNPICVPKIVTTGHLVLDPVRGPNSVVPTFVQNSLTTRRPVLDPPNSVVPTFVTICQLNLVTVRHLVLHPIFLPFVPTVVPIFVTFICFHFSRHKLTTRTSTAHQALKCCLRALDWTVLEPVAAVPTVVPLVLMLGEPTNSALQSFVHQSASFQLSA